MKTPVLAHPALAILIASAGFSVGCSSGGKRDETMPSTFPVSGTLTTEKGEAYKGGSVQFKSEKDPDLTVVGDVGEDGTFKLHTIKGSSKADGAPPGSYEVMINPPIGADQKMPFTSFTAPKKYEVQPKETKLEIKADPPKK
jgi:hypothetical protein